MARRARYLAFERLSEEGQGIVLRGCEEDWTQPEIQAELLKTTGETMSNGALGRFVINWRQQNAIDGKIREQTSRLIEALKANDVQLSGSARALISLGLQANIDEVGELGLKDTLRLAAKMGEQELKAQSLKLQERRVAGLERELELKERQIEALEQKEERVRAAAERAQKVADGAAGLPDEVRAQIREIYGLTAGGSR